MNLCIPVRSDDGLASEIEAHLPAAQSLLFFDTETRSHTHVSLSEPEKNDDGKIPMDAVLCGSIDRNTLRHLIGHGINVYGTGAVTVAEAIAQFERGELVAASMPSGGCCGGHGHGHHDHEGDGASESHGCGGGCGGGGCGGHGAGHEHGDDHGHAGGGCCGGHSAAVETPDFCDADAVFRVAVCSQNRKTVTEHAGKCRKFWIYEIRQGQVGGRTLLELPIEQAFHSAEPGQAHPLDDVDVLISASMGGGLKQRLADRGIQGFVTTETDPDLAVAALLAGDLATSGHGCGGHSGCSHKEAGTHRCGSAG